ncbi:hypothetical protein FPV67DRAFT_291725 [Lyophyllum atratum]|nr:hypothetical protein FPV67DRAFT_291725 [Lyophyllum atratum]
MHFGIGMCLSAKSRRYKYDIALLQNVHHRAPHKRLTLLEMLASVTSLLLASLFAILQPRVIAAATVQDVSPRDFPPGLSIPDDITKWGRYGYLGCFTDDHPGSNSLTVLFSGGPTIERCLDFCNSQAGYYNLAYVGLGRGGGCFCDWVLQNTAVQVDDSECNVPCSGNSSQPCGAQGRLTIVSLPGSPTSAPAVVNGNGKAWAYQGCYHDSQTAKVFPYRAIVDTRFFTLEVCADACGRAGFHYAGVEYRDECWCGTASQLEGVVKGPNDDCGMACIYNYFERCGNADRMSVYKVT